jgi:hypothetical protein
VEENMRFARKAVDAEVDLGPIIPIKRGLDPAADRIVRDMSEYIAGAEAFTFSVEVAEDKLLAHQHMIQYGGVAQVTVRRPGSLHSAFRESRQVCGHRRASDPGRCDRSHRRSIRLELARGGHRLPGSP